jgi:hypothetical protein
VRLGPRNLEAGDQLQWLTSGDIDKRKCTWWSDHVDRVKTVVERVERGSGTLGGRSVEDGGDTRRVAGDAYGVRYSWRFGELSLKTTG